MLKAREHRTNQFPTWVAKFRTFYQRYPEEFEKHCAQESVLVPELWKCLGDELIFCREIKSAKEVVKLLRAFRAATIAFQNKPNSIKLKNAAWLADFPVGNSEVLVRDATSKKPRTDYLGPHMDLGFRLTHQASLRRFVISVEVAMLIHHWVNDLRVFYEGSEVLKGVLDERPYPVLWIDMHDPNQQSLEDRLRGNAPHQNDLKEFCEHFAKDSDGQVGRPYLPGEPEFDVKPDNWDANYARACKLSEAEDEIPVPAKDDRGEEPNKGLIQEIVKAVEPSAPMETGASADRRSKEGKGE
jgi:hypothetical protein